jgi:sterol desaturase/sphingolipid hydroxylase (fatty acid hydroxylase superfamily)
MSNCTDTPIGMTMGDQLWQSFATSSIGQWEMLEAYVSGACFAVFIIFFRLLDQVSFMNKYRLSPETKPMPLFQPDPNNSWVPLFIYIVVIHVFHHFYPKPLPDTMTPSCFRVLFELASGLFLYDFIFYWLHYAMHVVPMFSFMKHQVHHTQSTMCSSEVQHHSFLDGSF